MLNGASTGRGLIAQGNGESSIARTQGCQRRDGVGAGLDSSRRQQQFGRCERTTTDNPNLRTC